MVCYILGDSVWTWRVDFHSDEREEVFEEEIGGGLTQLKYCANISSNQALQPKDTYED